MRRISFIVSVFAAAELLISSRAVAQRWLRLGDFGQTVYLDTTTITHHAGGVVVVQLRLPNDPGPGYDHLETQEVDCMRRQSRVTRVRIETVSASTPGDLRAPPPDTAWRSYTPGSLGAGMLDAVCAYVDRSAQRGP